jgi:hypothetical protein
MSFQSSFERFLQKRNRLLFRTSLFSLFIGLFAAAFAPTEKVIGKALALVYLHIGFFAGALVLFFLTIIAAILFSRIKAGRVLIGKLYTTGGIAWFIYFLLSVAVAWMSWGGIFWQEPRMVIAVRVIFIFLIAQAVYYFLERKYVEVVFGSAAFLSILIWLFRFSIFHPRAPIRESNSLAIKAFAVISIFSTALSVLLLALSLAGRDLGND